MEHLLSQSGRDRLCVACHICAVVGGSVVTAFLSRRECGLLLVPMYSDDHTGVLAEVTRAFSLARLFRVSMIASE